MFLERCSERFINPSCFCRKPATFQKPPNWWRDPPTHDHQYNSSVRHFFVLFCFFVLFFCVAYTKCKPRYVMIQDIYSWLDLSRWTERLSRGSLSSKIGSSLRSAKLRKLQSFRKRPVCNDGCNTLSKIVFYLVFSSSLLLRLHMPAFLQSASLLSANYSVELCSHRPTFHGLDL